LNSTLALKLFVKAMRHRYWQCSSLVGQLGFIIPPYFLESVQHLAPWQSGLVNLSVPLGLMLLSKASGKLMGRTGTRPLMVTGLTVTVFAYGSLSLMRADWPPFFLAILLFVYGVGAGIFVQSNLLAIMGAVGKESQGTIGAVQRMIQNLGIAVDTAVAAALIRIHAGSRTAGLMVGFREAWGYATITLSISLLLFVFIFVQQHKSRSSIATGDAD
jgi:MFS family permease